MSKSQINTVLKHLKITGSITVRDAMVEYNIMSLPRRILDLEELGYSFNRVNKTNPVTGQRYTRYYLVSENA